jgi:hypothetical protein
VSPIRYLAATAGCAVLLGLAVTGFVRARLSELEASVVAVNTGWPAQTERDPSPAPQEPGAGTGESDTLAAVSAREPASKAGAARSLRSTSAKKRPSKPSSLRQSERGSFFDQLDRGVTKVGEGRYEIERAALDLALNNLALLAGGVRVVPEIRDSKPVGFRLLAIAADGPFAKLGLRDEDVLVSINHLDLSTVEKVLDAYGKLKTARHLVLGLLRGGRKAALEFTIH